MGEGGEELATGPNILYVIKVKHVTSKSGHRSQNILEQFDLHSYQKENKMEENFCRKDRDTLTQLKFSCFPCRTVIESVLALRSHLKGNKHLANLKNPPEDINDFVMANGKWKKGKGEKRSRGDEPSRRERTKRNKMERNIPILPQHTVAKYTETETYFHNGLRKVRPYYFTFTAHAKGRWVGQTLREVFTREFRAMPPGELLRCIAGGDVKVNNSLVPLDYRVQNNDFITHTVHRHELPVTEDRVRVIHQDDELVVVDKPPSIPVHPCGRYRHNTVIFILAKEEALPSLHTVHRLDRLTSGVLIFSKNSRKSREMEVLISQRQVKKEYVCRVTGEFPEGEIVCEEPIEVISYKIGVCVISPERGKPCKTVFNRIAFKDGVSIVSCQPHTGRMHQIRVHLQYLGYPIANDPLYNSTIFGPERGRLGNIGGKTHQQLISDLIANHSVENWIKSEEYLGSKLQSEEGEEEGEKGGEEGYDESAEDLLSTNKELEKVASANEREGGDHVTSGSANERELVDHVTSGSANEEGGDHVTSGSANEKEGGDHETSDSANEKEGGDDVTSRSANEKEGGDDVTSGSANKNEGGDHVTSGSANEKEGGAPVKDTYYDPHCLDCKLNYKDPPKDTLVMYLHALRYSGEGWSYSTPLPPWAVL